MEVYIECSGRGWSWDGTKKVENGEDLAKSSRPCTSCSAISVPAQPPNGAGVASHPNQEVAPPPPWQSASHSDPKPTPPFVCAFSKEPTRVLLYQSVYLRGGVVIYVSLSSSYSHFQTYNLYDAFWGGLEQLIGLHGPIHIFHLCQGLDLIF